MLIQVKENCIPNELRECDQWVLWKETTRDGKPTKMPYQATGALAESNNPETWCSFDVAVKRYGFGGWAGIGWVFAENDPYTGVDLDGCRNPETGKVLEWAKEIIAQFGTYAEVSPSGTGVKLWCRGRWDYESGHKIVLPDAPRINDKTPAVEVYDSVRFFAMTGVILQGHRQIVDCQPQLDALRTRFWPLVAASPRGVDFRSESAVTDRARKYLAKMDVSIQGQDGSKAAFRAACVLVLGFSLPAEDAMALLREWNANCQPPWSERELLHKVSDACKKTGDRGYLRNVSPENYSRVPMPNYNLPDERPIPEPPEDWQPEPPRNAPKQQPIVETTLAEAARGHLKRVSEGAVQVFKLGLPGLDHALGGGVEAGEMIIFAARPGHAKSMGAQQVADTFTANGIPVLFISEEMSSTMLGKRAVHFVSEINQDQWDAKNTSVAAEVEKHFQERQTCYIVEGCRTADRVAEQIRRYVNEKHIGLAIIDYAQLLAGKGKGRYEEITNVSITLRNVISECKIPVIVLCQMSRAIETRTKFTPQMSDIKETGQLEQDADVIVFQVWPYKIDPEQDPDEYLFFIAKNRSRETNAYTVKCKIEAGRQRLVDNKVQQPEASKYMNTFDDVDLQGDF